MAATERVSISDIEARLRSVTDGAGGVLGSAKPNVITGGVVGGVVLLAAAFLFGRRRGRRRATVLEIHRA